jgi:hypothetical protein
MRRELSAYEVRCPRCDVSFPVGTRTCMHCGGPTSGAGRVQLLESMAPTEHSTSDLRTVAPTGSDSARFDLPDPRTNGGEIDEVEQPASVGRTLFRSFGGIIWVLVLIAFSLARNCGEN